MSDPETLTSFIRWAAVHYPARNYALLMGDHGYGWQGLIIDMTSQGRFMTVKDLRSALRKANVHIDLLALDACLMQMSEVMYEILDTPVDIVVGSENAGTTWPLADIIQRLTADPQMSAESLGRIIPDLYLEYHQQDPPERKDDLTLSTLRLGGMGAVTIAVQELADAFLSSAPLATIQEKARAVLSELDETIVYVRNGANWTSAGGLSIYFPLPEQGFMPTMFFYNYIDEVVSFARDVSWREVLFVYYNYMDYKGVLNDSIFRVRSEMNAFDGANVDLYDFCKRLVEYEE
jgi:hypothetical protein